MAWGLSAVTWALLVLVGVLLLLMVSTGQAGGQAVPGQEVPHALAPWAPSGQWLPSRAKRATPFWRMVGSKPLGAHCARGLECSSHLCRNGHCAGPHARS